MPRDSPSYTFFRPDSEASTGSTLSCSRQSKRRSLKPDSVVKLHLALKHPGATEAFCSPGLNMMRSTWDRPADDPPPPLGIFHALGRSAGCQRREKVHEPDFQILICQGPKQVLAELSNTNKPTCPAPLPGQKSAKIA